MEAKRELRKYAENAHVWVGKYRGLINLLHWHDDCEIIYAEKEGGSVMIDGKSYALREGQSVFIAPKETHCIQSGPESILCFFLYDRSLAEQILAGRALKKPVLEHGYDFPGLFGKIEEELAAGNPLSMLSVNNRIERLTIDIFSQENIVPKRKKETDSERTYRELIADINARYADYNLAEAAKFTSLSESYFSKFFRRMADMTFSHYLNLVRTEHAVTFIHEKNRTMTEIAIQCGFGTIRNFNRVFKEITGYSPRTLPPDYNILDMHPTYGTDDVFNPTLSQSQLL